MPQGFERGTIQGEYYIAIDKAIHEKMFDCGCHGRRKHLKKSIKTCFGRDPNAILHARAEDRRCKYVQKDSFIVTWPSQKSSGK